jgi:hypothetical protein
MLVDLEYVQDHFLWNSKRSYQCECCFRCFGSSPQLGKHHSRYRGHMGSAHLECYFCSAAFDKVQTHDFVKHFVTHLGEERPFQCKKCKGSFGSQAALHMHIDKFCGL